MGTILQRVQGYYQNTCNGCVTQSRAYEICDLKKDHSICPMKKRGCHKKRGMQTEDMGIDRGGEV